MRLLRLPDRGRALSVLWGACASSPILPDDWERGHARSVVLGQTLKRLLSLLADNRASLAAWLGLLLLAQALAAATSRPDIIWPAALGVGALTYSCAATVVDWAMARVVRQPAEVSK